MFKTLTCFLVLVGSSAAIAGDLRYESPRFSTLFSAFDFLKREVGRQWAGNSRYDCHTYEDKNIELLDAKLADRAARFIHAWNAHYTGIILTSAHRTKVEQTCVCVGEKGPCAGRVRWVKVKKGRKTTYAKRGGGTSRHQLGVAVDMYPAYKSLVEFKCMHEFAELNSFGVTFPLGMRDRVHMELAHGRQKGRVRTASLDTTIGIRQIVPCKSLPILSHVPID